MNNGIRRGASLIRGARARSDPAAVLRGSWTRKCSLSHAAGGRDDGTQGSLLVLSLPVPVSLPPGSGSHSG